MTDKYELIYYFHHCVATNVYSAGRVDTTEKAEMWVKEKEKLRRSPEDTDPRCDCRADYCPLKHSAPVYSYRKIED